MDASGDCGFQNCSTPLEWTIGATWGGSQMVGPQLIASLSFEKKMWFLSKSIKFTELSHEIQKSSKPRFDYLETEEFLIASQWWRNLSLFLPVHTLGINSCVCITPLIRLTAAEVIALWFLYGSVCACVCKPHDQRFEQNVEPHLRTANSVKCDILLWNWKEVYSLHWLLLFIV